MSYAVACKSCGNVLETAWEKVVSSGSPDGEYLPSQTPLTEKGRIPVLCPRCGSGPGNWRQPASPEEIAKFHAAEQRTARAGELCRTLNPLGLFKIPDDVRIAPEIKVALSNLLAPLEGDALARAEVLIRRVAKSGIAVNAELWIELYDQAVTKAVADAKEAAKEAKTPRASRAATA